MAVKYTGGTYSFSDSAKDELQRAAFMIACNADEGYSIEKWCAIYAAASKYPYKECLAYLKGSIAEMRELNDVGRKFACRVLNFTEVE